MRGERGERDERDERGGGDELPELSILIPVFEEAENLELLYKELTEALGTLPPNTEILFVDDGSKDLSFRLLSQIARNDPRVHVLRFDHNHGQTAAFQAGFDHARGKVLVTLDGDLQNDPADIGRLLVPMQEGADLVVGWRKNRHDTFLRRFLSHSANGLLRYLTGVDIHDTGCSLKACRREMADRLTLVADQHRFIPLLVTLVGGRVREIEVHHRPRRAGTSHYGFARIWQVFLDLFTVALLSRFITRPALYFSLLGLPFFFATVLAFAGALQLYSQPQVLESLPVVLPGAALLFAFASLHLMLMAIFGEFLVWAGGQRRRLAALAREVSP